MNIIAVIPARMGSSRYPGKPLEKILEIPMIGHVYWRTRMSKLLSEVYIATCDEEILRYAESIGAKCIMTSSSHERATDRTAEAMLIAERDTGKKVDIIVMVQGDEPMTHPEMIGEAVGPLIQDSSILVSNLMAPIEDREEHDDPNEVKVVVDLQGYALYFSREPVPSWRKGAQNVPMLKQVCIIPFRRDFLLKFNSLSQTPLEVTESVDMLRVLEHGYRVKVILTQHRSYSVDTPEDLRFVIEQMKSDPLIRQYSK